MKKQIIKTGHERTPILDLETAKLLALWVESGSGEIRGERYIKYVDRVTAAIIALCAIGLSILAIDFYFFN